MRDRTAALGALVIGALIVASAAGRDSVAETAPVSADSADGGVLGFMSDMATGAGQGLALGSASAAETGRQFAVGAYYLGGELVESGRIIGTSTLQMLGILPTDSTRDQRHRNGPAMAGAWWGTSESGDTGGADSAPPTPRRDAVPASSTGGRATAATAQPAVTPVALSQTANAPVPANEIATADGASTNDVCGWTPGKASAPATLSGEDVAMLSRLGLMDESAQRLPDGTIFLPKVTQRLLEVRTAFTCKGTIATTRRLVGHVIANPTSSGLVQAEQNGRIEAGSFGFPVIGQRVEKGEMLGYLVPIISSRERAELQGEIALVRGQIAEHELMIARTRELPLLPFREGRILSMRIELSKLRAQRDALIDGLNARHPLVASVSGVIARAEVRVGQVVEERQLLWEIADTNDLWVEADSFGGGHEIAKTGSTAETSDGQVLALRLEGQGLSTNGAQSSPVLFRVDAMTDGVRIGEQVMVNVREIGKTEGVLVPRSALVRRGNGEMTVWVVKGPEQYEPRRVKWSPAGSHVAIIDAGLEEGQRVVIAGATMLSEVR